MSLGTNFSLDVSGNIVLDADTQGSSNGILLKDAGTHYGSIFRSGSDLNLKFWLHAFGSNMGDLFIYIDTNTASNHSTATLIQSYTSFSGYTANSSVWQQQTVSLNSYRAVDATHYFYFVMEGATGFRSDLAIDNVELIDG